MVYRWIYLLNNKETKLKEDLLWLAIYKVSRQNGFTYCVLIKESTLQSHQKPFSYIMHRLNYSDKDEALVVISVSLTEVKWAESLITVAMLKIKNLERKVHPNTSS